MLDETVLVSCAPTLRAHSCRRCCRPGWSDLQQPRARTEKKSPSAIARFGSGPKLAATSSHQSARSLRTDAQAMAVAMLGETPPAIMTVSSARAREPART